MKIMLSLVIVLILFSCSTTNQYIPSSYSTDDIYVPVRSDLSEGLSVDLVTELDYRPELSNIILELAGVVMPMNHINFQAGLNTSYNIRSSSSSISFSLTPSVFTGIAYDDNIYSTLGGSLQGNTTFRSEFSDEFALNIGLGYVGSYDGFGSYYEFRGEVEDSIQDPYSSQINCFIEFDNYFTESQHWLIRIEGGFETFHTLNPIFGVSINEKDGGGVPFMGGTVGYEFMGNIYYIRGRMDLLGFYSFGCGMSFL